MWSPTHVQVTVQRARNLKTKGRGATNDAFVLIQMGKDKFQTSVKEKCIDPEWYEECDLTCPQTDANVVLTAYHRNLIGIDEFLGEVSVPVRLANNLDRPVNKWYSLKGRGGKEDGKERGEIEVRIALVVRSCDTQSLNEFALGKKRRGLKGFATSVSHKLQKIPSRSFSLRSETFDPRGKLSKLRERKNSTSSVTQNESYQPQYMDNDGNGEELPEFEEFPSKVAPRRPFRKFSPHYSSTLSLPQSAMIPSIKEDKSLENEANAVNEDIQADETSDSSETSDGAVQQVRKRLSSIDNTFKTRPPLQDDWARRISRIKGLTRSEINLSDATRNDFSTTKEKKTALESIRNTLRRHTLQLAEPPDLSPLKIFGSPKKNNAEINKKNNANKIYRDSDMYSGELPMEVWRQYEKMNQQDLVMLAIQQQTEIERMRDRVSDLESYLDNLLVRVMETTPKILQTPYESLDSSFSR